MAQICAVLEPDGLGQNDSTDGEFDAPGATKITGVQACELEQYRQQLLHHAQWLLGNREAAQDAVQDTMLAALHALDRFGGRSSVRTWLFGILKHKVMDAFRLRAREVPLADSEEELDDPDAHFETDGRWRKPPSHWGDPEQLLNRKQFFEVLERCIDRLPKNAARVFTMREILGMETDEICAALGITRTNCFVILHRTRVSLRNLLESAWSIDASDGRGESALGFAV